MRSYGIRTLLIAGAALVAVMPALIVAGASGLYLRDRMIESTLRRTQGSAEQLASIYEMLLDRHLSALATVASHLAVADLQDAAGVTAHLARVRAIHPSFASAIAVADPDGQIFAIASSVANPALSRVADREWFQEVLRTRKPLVDAQVIRSRTTGQSVVVLAAPVLRADGRLVAVVSGGLSLEDLARLAARAELGETGYPALAAADGTLLMHPRRDLVADGYSVAKEAVWAAMGAGAQGRLEQYDDLHGSRRIGGFATVANAGWKVWVGQAQAEINDALVDTYARTALLAGLGTGGGLLLAVFVAGAVARPIERLREAATAVAGGDLERTAEEGGPRETADLGRALNAMSTALRQRLQDEQEAQAGLRRDVAQYAGVARRIASGDLAVGVPPSSHAELGPLAASLNDMTSALARIVGEIGQATANLTSASSEILVATSQQVSATAEEAVAVKQTASSVAEVKQTGALAMQKARAVAQAAQRATEVVESGRRTVEASIEGSRESKQRMEALAQRILGFIEHAEAIAEINASVNELAEQSNLLAVNASIEAAKAGDVGRGFAVVAGEIKGLSDQSKQATAQVRRILTEIQKASQAAMLAAEQGVKSAEAGVGFAGQSGEAIHALANSITEAAQAGQQIVAASQEQQAGMDQIAAAMQNIEQSTNQTVAATRQVEGAARDLNDLAQRLSDLVAFAGGHRAGA